MVRFTEDNRGGGMMALTRPKATVLLVDDDPMITALLGAYFPEDRFQVLTAAGADEALRLFDSQPVDVVVSDERMPGESGSALLAAVRRRYPRTIRILHAGRGTPEPAARAINDAEVHRLFHKPCKGTDLVAAVEQLLREVETSEAAER
jgi:DNA-binding NtrC family response regulator